GWGMKRPLAHHLLPPLARGRFMPQPLDRSLTRRGLLSAAAAAGATAAIAATADTASAAPAAPSRLKFCLNMSTIRGQKLSLPDQVDVAAKAGYDAIEPWIGEVRQYQQGGGSIDDLRKRIADHGL